MEGSKSPNDRQPAFTFQVNLATPKPEGTLPVDGGCLSDSNDGELKDDANQPGVNVVGQFFRLEAYSALTLTDEQTMSLENWLNPAIRPFLKLLVSHLQLKIDILDRICLVESSILGEVIFQVQREKGLKPMYTGQSGYYHTAGKTISYATETGEVKSTVVCNFDICGLAFEALAKGKLYSEWTVEEELSYYVTAHEIGHALDKWARKDASTDEVVSISEEDWERISTHYAPMLFDEYLACRIAAASVTPRLQSSMLKEWQDDVERFIEQLNSKRAAFASDRKEVTACFWIILVQLAKLLGHDRGEDGYPEIAFGAEEWEEVETKQRRHAIVTELAETLDTLIKAYPTVPPETEVVEALTPYFVRLAASFGFIFREEDMLLKSSFDED